MGKTSKKTPVLNAAQKEFAALMAAAGWSAAETSRQLAFSRGAVSQILAGQVTPRPQTLDLLRTKVLAAHEAAHGKYPQGEEAVIVREQKESFADKLQRAAQQIFTAPIISWARGGEGSYYEDQGPNTPHIAVPCKDPNCYVLQLEGDSMHPLYVEGDLLVVAPNMQPMNNDHVIVKTTEGEVFFKRYKVPARGEEFQFHSYNPHHPPIFLTPDKIFRVSVVHTVIRPLKEGVRAMTVSESSHL